MPRFLLSPMAAVFVVTLAVVGIAHLPVETRRGTNYKWSTHKIYLYEKALHFLSRDARARRLASAIGDGASNNHEKLLKVFDWTVVNVRPTPVDFPIVDDHLQNIITRGYGEPDQMAEVMSLLASYLGFPATIVYLASSEGQRSIVLSVVQCDSEFLLFDVHNQVVFEREPGHFASLKEIRQDTGLVRRASNGMLVYGKPYEMYFADLQTLTFDFTRMDKQKPILRIWSEFLGFLRFFDKDQRPQ